MSESIFYSDAEVIEITNRTTPKLQIAWLRKNGYYFHVNLKKRPVVPKNQIGNITNNAEPLLTRKQIVEMSTPIKRSCGVYFLIKSSKIIYVGKSTNLLERLGDHFRNDNMVFDSYTYIETSEEECLALEEEYITLLSPKMNKTFMPKNKKLA